MDQLIPLSSSNKRLAISLAGALCVHLVIILWVSSLSITPSSIPKKTTATRVSLTFADKSKISAVRSSTATHQKVDEQDSRKVDEAKTTSSEVESTERVSQKNVEDKKMQTEEKPVEAVDESRVEKDTAEQDGKKQPEPDDSSASRDSEGASGRAPTESGKEITWSAITQGKRLPVPSYPSVAKRFGYEGLVQVAIKINAEGKVESTKIRSSSGYRILDRAVVETIQNSWEFHPPGREITVVKDFVFELER